MPFSERVRRICYVRSPRYRLNTGANDLEANLMSGDVISIDLPTDGRGLVDQWCAGCEGYFKIRFGTGILVEGHSTSCPYCRRQADPSEFATPEQVEYAKAVALEAVTQEFGKTLERSASRFLKVTTSAPKSVGYDHRGIDLIVVCKSCSLEYGINGTEATTCPDCLAPTVA